jgi:hypothetical protein
MAAVHAWRTFIAFELAPISAVLTAAHVVRRIAAERAYVDDRGAFGIRAEPAAAILRRCGGQSRRAPGRGRMRRSVRPPGLV